MRPVNFTDVSLGLNHQVISFVLIKRLILNMNRAAPEPGAAAPARSWRSMKQAGRGRKWRSGRERGRRGGGESRGHIRKKPKRALTKAPVNLQAPLTRSIDGNSLTARRIFPPLLGRSSGSLEERLQSSVGGSIQHSALNKIMRNDSRRKKKKTQQKQKKKPRQTSSRSQGSNFSIGLAHTKASCACSPF